MALWRLWHSDYDILWHFMTFEYGLKVPAFYWSDTGTAVSMRSCCWAEKLWREPDLTNVDLDFMNYKAGFNPAHVLRSEAWVTISHTPVQSSCNHHGVLVLVVWNKSHFFNFWSMCSHIDSWDIPLIKVWKTSSPLPKDIDLDFFTGLRSPWLV